ncbi:MAG: hypothetical protein ACLGHJ_09795 [Gammaproteobacteria bacterium]
MSGEKRTHDQSREFLCHHATSGGDVSGNIPGEIVFWFERDSGPASGVIVYFVLRSRIKNPFVLGPLVTSPEGDIVLTLKMLEEEISSSKSQFPMDYGGDIDDCDLLSVLVESRAQLEKRVGRLLGPYPEASLSLRVLLDSATNAQESVREDINLPVKGESVRIRL